MRTREYLNIRILPVLGVLLLFIMLARGLQPPIASANSLVTRSLTLEAQGAPGSAPSDGNSAHNVKHLFTFTLAQTTSLGSIKFLYCTTPNPANPCTTPSGLVTTSATLTAQTQNTGFVIDATTNGAPFIHRTAAAGDTSNPSTYELSGILNPDNTNCVAGADPSSANNCTFYVRISTYTGIDGATGPIDSGTVAASTATPIVLSGYMPESLVFCTGGTVSTTGGVPDCTTATSGTVAFNQDFSPTATATALSQMAASTNAGTGYSITVNGTTMTSGANTIAAMGATAGNSIHGTAQFGMNLVLNDGSPVVPYSNAPNIAGSANVAPVANGTNLRGQAKNNYNADDEFAYNSGDSVADSGNGGLGGTDAQIFTASYIVNVSGSQPAGTYTTTLTYICTPTF